MLPGTEFKVAQHVPSIELVSALYVLDGFAVGLGAERTRQGLIVDRGKRARHCPSLLERVKDKGMAGAWPGVLMNGPFVVAGISVAVPASRSSPGPETLDKTRAKKNSEFRPCPRFPQGGVPTATLPAIGNWPASVASLHLLQILYYYPYGSTVVG